MARRRRCGEWVQWYNMSKQSGRHGALSTGDRVRLGDTNLFLTVEKDLTVYGEECKFGGGKVLREGMGQQVGPSVV